MSGIVRLVTDTARPKHVDVFHYASTTVDLADGNLVAIDVGTTTYGLGKSVVISPAAADTDLCPGCVDRVVDASVDGPLWIPVVTQGVKASCTVTGVDAKEEVNQSGTLGTLGDAAGTETAMGRALDGSGSIWFFGLYRCSAPA